MAASSSLFSAACGVLSQVGAAGGADQKGAVQDCDSKLVLHAFQSHPPCPASPGRGSFTYDRGAEHRIARVRFKRKLECTIALPPIIRLFAFTCNCSV